MPRTFIICAVASTLTAVTRAEATVKARHLLEIGDIRLVVDGERLHVEPFDGSWVERRRLA